MGACSLNELQWPDLVVVCRDSSHRYGHQGIWCPVEQNFVLIVWLVVMMKFEIMMTTQFVYFFFYSQSTWYAVQVSVWNMALYVTVCIMLRFFVLMYMYISSFLVMIPKNAIFKVSKPAMLFSSEYHWHKLLLIQTMVLRSRLMWWRNVETHLCENNPVWSWPRFSVSWSNCRDSLTDKRMWKR